MVCDWWECRNREDCEKRQLYSGTKYPPCGVCIQFDLCASCSHFVECSGLVCKYLPNMFRRMVREIRLGEDTEKTQQYIKRNTLGGRKRK